MNKLTTTAVTLVTGLLISGCALKPQGVDLKVYGESDYAYVRVGLIFGNVAAAEPTDIERELDFGDDRGGSGSKGGSSGGGGGCANGSCGLR